MLRLHPALLAALLLILAACASTGTQHGSSPGYSGSSSLSSLLARPLTWDKLDDLEVWIDRNGSRASSKDRNDARLALADGRASFITKDAGSASPAVLDMRQARAEADYKLVLADGGASSAQRGRAQSGIARLRGPRTTGLPAAVQTAGVGTKLTVVRRSTWGASAEVPRNMTRHSAPWNKITVHHTAMPVGSTGSLAARTAELRMIQRSHLNKPEGWGDIGYHFLIDPEGRIYEGRRLSWRGAHVGGQNDHNLGVSLMGNFEVTRPTAAALASLERLLDDLRSENGITRSAVTYHREWPTAATECPGAYLLPWVVSYRGGARTSATALAATPGPSPAQRRTQSGWGSGGSVR